MGEDGTELPGSALSDEAVGTIFNCFRPERSIVVGMAVLGCLRLDAHTGAGLELHGRV